MNNLDSTLEINLVVAVSDAGVVECVPNDVYLLSVKRKAEDFIKEKRIDPIHRWHITYLRAKVPYPLEIVIDAEVINGEES